VRGALSDTTMRPPLNGVDAQGTYLRFLHRGVQPITGSKMSTTTHTTHTARITGPVTYVAASGRKVNIPLGPCMVECMNGALIDIVWGARGQSSAALPADVVKAAQDLGHLILLD
jgi:hypothetical protein